ncbi:hypothetical protein GCM10025759_21660 [Lysobacter panacisoli]|uniref:Uncharacterized protein n=1 Tax=Lysobacter panacisoli TaxID=1255263 RepID=A0ABP9LIN0_9GAMM
MPRVRFAYPGYGTTAHNGGDSGGLRSCSASRTARSFLAPEGVAQDVRRFARRQEPTREGTLSLSGRRTGLDLNDSFFWLLFLWVSKEK